MNKINEDKINSLLEEVSQATGRDYGEFYVVSPCHCHA